MDIHTHGTCHEAWTGLRTAHCPACHRTFTTDSAAERHRKGEYGGGRHCIDPAGIKELELKPDGTKWGWKGRDGRWQK